MPQRRDEKNDKKYSLKPQKERSGGKEILAGEVTRENVDETNAKTVVEGTEKTEDNGRGDDREESVQEVECQNDEGHFHPWEKVERKKKNGKKRTPIIICGDSMVKEIGRNIRLKEQGSELCCMPGANIINVMEKVKEKCKDSGDDMVVIQGGGNNLTGLGYRKTTEEVVKNVKEILAVNSNRKIAVLSILKRPREFMNMRYDEERKRANREIQTEICKMKIKQMQVSFIDLDPIILDSMYSVDGIHLNREGNDRLSARILTWMKQKETKINDGNRK